MDSESKNFLVSILLYLFVAFIVRVGKHDRVTKDWARFFSITQIIMALQTAVGWAYRGNLYDDIGYLFSALNNPFFLGAALILLDRKPDDNWRSLFRDKLFQIVTLISLALIALKIILLAIGRSGLPVDVAITLISVVVYFVEGRAYYIILDFYRYKRTRYLPLIVALSFSLLELALNVFPNQKLLLMVLFLAVRFLYLISPFMILLIRMPQDLEVKKAFGNAVEGRNFILSPESGFVEALGSSIAADKVLLLIKNPNFQLERSTRLIDQFTSYGWQETQSREQVHTHEDEMLRERELDCLHEVCMGRHPVFCKSADRQETIMLPIIMYGGMIGTLMVRLKTNVRARSIFAEKLKLSVQNVLPLVQSSRQWLATSRLSDRFTEKLIAEENSGTQAEKIVFKVTDGVDDILGSLLDNLSPLAVAIKLSRHFNSQDPVLWKIDPSHFPGSKKEAFEKKYFNAAIDRDPQDNVEPFQQDLELGRLILFVREDRDSLDRPAIGVHHNVFKALAALIDNALKTIIRHNLDKILTAADRKISEERMDGYQTAQVLQEAIGKFGISWIVIAVDQTRFFGADDRIELAQKYTHLIKEDGQLKPHVITDNGQKSSLITFSTTWTVSLPQKSQGAPVDETEYSQTRSNGHSVHPIWFYFGMENPEFRLDHTWEYVFHQFIEIGTNKIKDILLREVLMKAESQIAAIENKKAIMSLLYLRGNLTHKFGTLIKHLGSSITKMTDDVNNAGVTLPENIYSDVESLKTRYEELQKLARAMFKDARHIKLHDISEEDLNKRPSDLCAAIEIVLDKMRLNLDHAGIKIDLRARNGNGLMVDVPFLVVYLSIFNLLSNAINALRQLNKRSRSKKISISTRVNGHRILCSVADTGPGFENTNQLYELDAGWGLYLTKVSLEDYNSSLDLVENSPSGATFELSFPVRRQESEPIPWRISNAS